MKNLSLLSLATLMLGFSSGCVLSIGDDTADEASTDDNATTDATDDATTDATTTNGDGDGDTTTTAGDTIGDTTTTAGDTTTTAGDTTETTGGANMCGWFADGGYYECGYEGTDPGGSPIECPDGLVEGDPCDTTGLSGAGCCDANGDNWYCTQEGTVFFNSCAG